MAGYYFMDAPNVSVGGESRTEALETAELKSVISCLLRAHTDAMLFDETTKVDANVVFSTTMPCAEKFNVRTQKLCGDERKVVASCTPDKVDKTVSNYIITTTDIISDAGAGKVLEILASEYPHAANVGIITIENKVPFIITSGGARREISRAIAKEAEFAKGQLAYITQYAVQGVKSAAAAAQAARIRCGRGEIAIFRQNQWSCVQSNVHKICSGDYIWDAGASECVPDNSKRPFCRGGQSAVMVEGVWECKMPENQKTCPKGMTAQLNYNLMEWECIANAEPEAAEDKTKCAKIYDRIYGGGTTALRGSLISCNDCEKMIVHPDCTAECVPDGGAAAKKTCYAGNCQYFYFGFPDARYIANARRNIPELEGIAIPLDDSHSRNRKFNCMECPYGINALASLPPYVIICN